MKWLIITIVVLIIIIGGIFLLRAIVNSPGN